MKFLGNRRFAVCAAPLALVAALALAACSAPVEGDGGAALEMAPLVSTHEDVTEALTVGLVSQVNTLDPLTVSIANDVQVLQLIAGTLFALAPDGKSVAPSLAQDAVLSEDGLTFEVTLKDGVEFTDGTPLTADDVVATFERALAFEANVYLAQIQPVVAVKSTAANAVQFTFDRPYPSFETFLAYPNMAIVKADEIGGDLTLPDMPTFAGAYVPTGDFFANEFGMERNDGFVGDLPAAKELKFTSVTDGNTRVQQVRTGQLDFAVDPTASQFESLGDQALPQAIESIGFNYLNMNNESGATSDVNVRKAISLALDREQITEVATGGYAQPLAGFFPSMYPAGQGGDTTRDVEAAKKMLEGTECASGCEISVMAAEEWTKNVAVVAQQNLAEIGITIEIESMEPQAMYERIYKAEFDMQVGMFGDYSLAPEGLPAYCMQFSAGYMSCLSFYESSEADSAVIDLTLALNEEEAAGGMDSLNAIFLKDQPYATLSASTAMAVVSPAAAGVISMGATNLIHVAKLSS